ncbi:reverse transcriptase domain-containing protein [Nephila pilipes]|uniref:Reverse transcriptase domain-containing protein n=1 Tax=Nephila pilipes TaxID=299642 RepID=A0A8X6JFR4_NEPPI|nr:reverse transcriptase domain-containing protein [Nephila pilipes]
MLPKPFSSQEFLLALALLDLKKSIGPDGLHGQMLKILGTRGKQRLLHIINLSWKIGRLHPEWKMTTFITIKKPEEIRVSPTECCPYQSGLKHSCPSNIVLFEADVQPLLFLRQTVLVKYFNKRSSSGKQNQTSKYLNNWVNRQILKKNSPFGQIESENFLTGEVEPSSLQCSLNPTEGLYRVYFHYNLSLPVIK